MAAVSIKGTKNGLVIHISGRSRFEDIKSELTNLMESACGFFREAKFCLHGFDHLKTDEKQMLENMCIKWGLVLDESILMAAAEKPANRGGNSGKEKPPEGDTVIKRNVRSGQRIVCQGDIVVVGNVNPGAELVAGGSILVMGSLKGVAHAGATGDLSATITAAEMKPSQLRIGGLIACRPENDDQPQGEYPETAYVSDNQIVVDRCHAGNKWINAAVNA